MAYSRSQRLGAAAVGAVVAVVVSVIATFAGSPFWGFFLAIVGGILGAVGLVMAASPWVRGGLISLVSVILAVVALVLSVLGMVGVILF